MKLFNKKKKKIKLLELEFDGTFKTLVITNSIFIVFFINASKLDSSIWDNKDWGWFIGYIIILPINFIIIAKLIKIYYDLKNRLSK